MRSIALIALLLCAACGSGGDSDPDSAAADSLTSAPATTRPADSAAPVVSAPQPDTAWRLRFDGLGPVRVGMTVDEARAALGGDLALTPDNPRHPEGPDRCDYPRSARLPQGVMLMVQGQRVARLEVDSGSVATAEGAKIGDSEARVQELYAGRVTVQPHKYTDGHYLVVRSAAAADTTHLLVFETDGRVVQRFRAGQKPQVEWVEGCS